MKCGIFEAIESADELVAANARHFTIDESRIDLFLERLPHFGAGELLEEDVHLIDPSSPERTLNYFFALETVNFGGPYSKTLRGEGFHEGGAGLYKTVAMRLKRYFEKNGDLPAGRMAVFESEDIAALFDLDISKPVSGRLAELFGESMREFGAFLAENHNSSFKSLFNSAAGKAERLVEMLFRLRGFHDSSSYQLRDGALLDVPLCKRAQHVTGSISLAFARMGRGEPFDDLHGLTAFPDNKIPHVMMVEGILKPSPQLQRQIDTGATFSVGSPEEVENRVLGRHIVRLMSRRSGEMQMKLDHRIWEHSHNDSLLGKIPYNSVPHLMISEPSFNY